MHFLYPRLAREGLGWYWSKNPVRMQCQLLLNRNEHTMVYMDAFEAYRSTGFADLLGPRLSMDFDIDQHDQPRASTKLDMIKFLTTSYAQKHEEKRRLQEDHFDLAVPVVLKDSEQPQNVEIVAAPSSLFNVFCNRERDNCYYTMEDLFGGRSDGEA